MLNGVIGVQKLVRGQQGQGQPAATHAQPQPAAAHTHPPPASPPLPPLQPVPRLGRWEREQPADVTLSEPAADGAAALGRRHGRGRARGCSANCSRTHNEATVRRDGHPHIKLAPQARLHIHLHNSVRAVWVGVGGWMRG